RDRDFAAAQALCGRQVRAAETDGKLSGLGMAGPMTPPPIPIELLTPTANADQAKITFQLAAMMGTATAELPGPDGSRIRLVLKRPQGKWLLVGVTTTGTYLPAPGKGGEGSRSPKSPTAESGRPKGPGEAGPPVDATHTPEAAPSKAKGLPGAGPAT
ncbi:MAG TPA: hypothetical protein PLQ54_16000, partial [Armatimonadota bacterium]|nr:hypothetical protein [Armatimonadota bacterium]